MAEYISDEFLHTGEYISRDNTLKAMQYSCQNCDNYNGVRCRACADADNMDIVSDMPAADVQPVNRWISVEDRLPEERKRVLVYNEGGITIAWRDKGEWDDIFLNVTHWQPLPEPPKDGDTE